MRRTNAAFSYVRQPTLRVVRSSAHLARVMRSKAAPSRRGKISVPSDRLAHHVSANLFGPFHGRPTGCCCCSEALAQSATCPDLEQVPDTMRVWEHPSCECALDGVPNAAQTGLRL